MNVVSDILGHSLTSTTVDIHAHVAPALRREAAVAMGRLLGLSIEEVLDINDKNEPAGRTSCRLLDALCELLVALCGYRSIPSVTGIPGVMRVSTIGAAAVGAAACPY